MSGFHTRSILCKPIRNRSSQTIGKQYSLKADQKCLSGKLSETHLNGYILGGLNRLNLLSSV